MSTIHLGLQKNWKVMKKAVRCFIFDLDGTLVDTYKANYRAYREAFREAGVTFTAKQYRQFFGWRLDDWVKKIIPEIDKGQLEKLKEDKSRFYEKNIKFCGLNNSLVTFLKYVKKMGYFTCLTTTASSKNAQYVLDYFDLKNLFDYIIYGEDVSRPKPDPECFDRCFKKFKVKPTECVIFEDSKTGCEAAVRSGATLIAVKVWELRGI